jgi:hypothetical protein
MGKVDLRVFEVTAAGFDASTDDTDDSVFWVSSPSEAEVMTAIADTGAAYCGETTGMCDASDVDFELPKQNMQFSSALLKIASDVRNSTRGVL